MTGTRTVRGILTDICIVVTMTLVIGVGVEVSARLARLARGGQAETPPRPEDALERYVQYVEFREGEYASPDLNIDRERRRRVPGSCERDDAFTVMAFGGSTMFGAGVADWHTIPAYLAASLNRQDRCVKVVNYGAGWWQSSQGVIQLLEVLKHRDRPDLVVFYDGVNDVNAVAWGGVPGGIAPDVAESFRKVFDPDPEGPFDARLPSWRHFARHSLIVRTLADRFLSPQHNEQHKDLTNDYAVPDVDMPTLATSLADIYAANVRTVNALAKEYGFTVHFFLQPVLMVPGKPRTAAEEASVRERGNERPSDIAMFNRGYQAFKAHPYLRSVPNYHDISDVFDGMTAELYLDSEHLQPEGNRIAAERIARDLVIP